MSTAPDNAMPKSAHKVVEQISSAVKDGGDAMKQSGSNAMEGFQSLAKAYQDMATHSYERQMASIKELSAVRSPTEFFQLQQKLVKETYEAAIADGQHISELTASAFSAACDPIQKQAANLQNTIKRDVSH